MTPFDISFLTVEEVPDDFHARFGTVGKEYRYVVKRTKILILLVGILRYIIHMNWTFQNEIGK